MKQKTLILLFSPLLLWACKDDDNPCNEPNLVETSFTNINGELINDYGEEVLTDRNTLYGISLFSGGFVFLSVGQHQEDG